MSELIRYAGRLFGAACTLLVSASGSAAPPEKDADLIPQGESWAYYDSGKSPGPGWAEVGFDDHAWRRGPAKLGYGVADQKTLLGIGRDPSHNPITVYFRHAFEVTSVERYTQRYELALATVCDDGCAVY